MRSVARAAGGRWDVIPTSVGGVGGARSVARRSGVGGMRAPWARDTVPKAHRPTPHRTLMRSPVVKGHTTPESGFFDFFSAVVEAQRRQPLATCSVFISVWGAPTWLHQTLMEVRAPRRRRVQ